MRETDGIGGLDNNTTVMAKCVDYMAPEMVPQVIEVNKYLASSAGKKAKKKRFPIGRCLRETASGGAVPE